MIQTLAEETCKTHAVTWPEVVLTIAITIGSICIVWIVSKYVA